MPDLPTFPRRDPDAGPAAEPDPRRPVPPGASRTPRHRRVLSGALVGLILGSPAGTVAAQDVVSADRPTPVRDIVDAPPVLRRRIAIPPPSELTAAAPRSEGKGVDGRARSIGDLPTASSPSAANEPLPTTDEIHDDRQRLYRELADEFNTFDRLGSLVRRVSTLVKPSVIHIEAHKSDADGGGTYDEAGSGVIIRSPDGDRWVLTNRHVIADAPPRSVLLRDAAGREFYPTRILSDESTDVAILRIDRSDLPEARLGDSGDVQIGDFVIAIGSPFGLSHSVTFGVLSAKGRRDLSLGEQKIELQDFFQTDAAINPGNSGGPLLNLRGEVVAVNTAIASSSGGSEGIGFAIPINMAVDVADQLIRFGRLRRGYLGVTLDPDFTSTDLFSGRFGDLAATRPPVQGGALVKHVRPGSPAAAANLRRGDLIVGYGEGDVENDDHLVTRVGLTPIGRTVPMIIYRDGRRYRTEITVGPLPR